jgi:hypothetical protein
VVAVDREDAVDEPQAVVVGDTSPELEAFVRANFKAVGEQQVVAVQELHERSARQADRPIVVRDRADGPPRGLDAEARIVERPHDFERPSVEAFSATMSSNSV